MNVLQWLNILENTVKYVFIRMDFIFAKISDNIKTGKYSIRA